MIDLKFENLKGRLSEITGNGKVILTKKVGKRNEYVFSVGDTNFSFHEKIYEDENFTAFSENLSSQEREQAISLLKEYL